MSFIGIDFGTSNSLVAFKRDNKLELLELSGQKSIPSALFFPTDSSSTNQSSSRNKENFYIGKEAIEQKFNEDEDGRILFSFKGLLADATFDKTIIHGFGEYTAEKLCGAFLKKIKERSEEYFKIKINGAVLGRPVEFSEQAIARLKQAATIAGFKEIYFQLEPKAAGLNYEQSLSAKDGEKIVFVCDFGGGTSDYAVLSLSAENKNKLVRKDDILAVGGIYKAGDSLNSDVITKGMGQHFGKGAKWGEKNLTIPHGWINALGNWKRLPFLRNEKIAGLLNYVDPYRSKDLQRLVTLVNENLGYYLHTEIDKAKITLPSKETAKINIKRLDLYENLLRENFEELISETIEEIQQEIPKTLNRAGLTADKISTVIMTGGSSLVPALQRAVAEIFDASKIKSVDPFNSVVGGLAIDMERRASCPEFNRRTARLLE